VLQQNNEREKAVSEVMQQALGQQDAGFRSAEQEQALHAVVDRQTPLVVVLPTGGGKSVLFSVPACMNNAGVTVVIVPCRALIEDLVSRMQKRVIDCIEWKHGESSPAAVVIVSADAACAITSNGNFIDYANLVKGVQSRRYWLTLMFRRAFPFVSHLASSRSNHLVHELYVTSSVAVKSGISTRSSG
jgi:hypothetical protein